MSIQYVDGNSNKVADALSRYYETDDWTTLRRDTELVSADIRVDPDMDDMPIDRRREIELDVPQLRAHTIDELRRSTRKRRET